MHKIRKLIHDVNKTHKRLGPLVAINLVCAKAKVSLLNVAPAGCGKSAATDAVAFMLGDKVKDISSVNITGLGQIQDELSDFDKHIIIDDLGAEKSDWSRGATVAYLADLVFRHRMDKPTRPIRITIKNFNGSLALNIQAVLMDELVTDKQWVSVIRDKVLRYYHVFRPLEPEEDYPHLQFDLGRDLAEVELPKHRGLLWYQLIEMGLVQWTPGRCKLHLPHLLRACAALDNRTIVEPQDHRLLIKLLKPMQLERYLIKSVGLETGREWRNDAFCIAVELATHKNPSILTICADYKVSPSTVEGVIAQNGEWCWTKSGSPAIINPTDNMLKVFKTCGVYDVW